MTSLNIKTKASASSLDAIKTLLLSIDPDAVISFDDDCELSKEDGRHLRETYEKKQNGQLKFYNDMALKQRLDLKGYKW
ncbi:MAG: hypothetical protein CR967_02730 [Proteobacteria bacterium]|nr:MAG: hypothetical protein CR967_02730 [Pseudomonadota bacterium]